MASANSKAIQTLANEIVAAMKSLTDSNNRSYVNNEIKNYRMTSSNVGKELYADFANIAAAQISVAEIDTAQIRDLETATIDTINLVARNASVESLDTDDFSAAIARVGLANIKTASIEHVQIKYFDTDEAIIRDGVGGKLFIDRLSVSNLQVVEETVGSLIIRAKDGNYYRLDVDIEQGKVTPVDVTSELDPSEIAAGVTSDGTRSIIETDLTVEDLSASNIKAINALIDKITAGRIDVGTLFADKTFAGKLYTNVIEAPSLILGDDSPYNIGEATWSSTAPINPKVGDGWVNTSVDPNEYYEYRDMAFYYDSDTGELYYDLPDGATYTISMDGNGYLIADGIIVTINSEGYVSTSVGAWKYIGKLTSVKSAINLSEDRIALIINTDETTPTRLVLTDGMINAVADKIELSASKINVEGEDINFEAANSVKFGATTLDFTGNDVDFTVADSVSFGATTLDFTGNNINLSAADSVVFGATDLDFDGTDIDFSASNGVNFGATTLDFTGNNIDFSAAESVTFDADQLYAIAQALTLEARNMSLLGNNIDITANESITLMAGNIESVQSAAQSSLYRFGQIVSVQSDGLHVNSAMSNGGEIIIDPNSVNVRIESGKMAINVPTFEYPTGETLPQDKDRWIAMPNVEVVGDEVRYDAGGCINERIRQQGEIF